MKKILLIGILGLFCMLNMSIAQAMEKIFYLTQDALNNNLLSQTVVNDIQAHASSIDILAPQIYSFQGNGLIVGDIDPTLLELAKKYQIKVMPLVTNGDFDQAAIHQLLRDPAAQKRAIDSMLSLSKVNNFYGMQFDLENIDFQDRDALTHFIQLAADAFHKNGYQLSIAVVPPLEDQNFMYDAYQRWVFENWSGAYDYYALSKSVDFMSLMTYDFHSGLTTPGPIAPINAIEKSLKILLDDNVPADKISLGIPLYSGYWISVPNIAKENEALVKPRFYLKRFAIDYSTLLRALAVTHKNLIWDGEAQVSYLIFNRHGRNEYLFVEDAKAFRAKVDLLNRYHLRGFSAWKIPLEDPGIWNLGF